MLLRGSLRGGGGGGGAGPPAAACTHSTIAITRYTNIPEYIYTYLLFHAIFQFHVDFCISYHDDGGRTWYMI